MTISHSNPVDPKMEEAWDSVEEQMINTGYKQADVDEARFLTSLAAYQELALYRSIENCKLCPLYSTCSGPVTGAGANRSPFMIIGESPGEHEDRFGLPLIGASGYLLTIVLSKLGIDRSQIFITNALKCMPPAGQKPTVEQVKVCRSHLMQEIQVVKPKVILTLGNIAMYAIHDKYDTKITKERGTMRQWNGIDVMHTYHPSYVLRQKGPDLKRVKKEFWEDLSNVKKRLDQVAPGYDFMGNLTYMAKDDSDGTDSSKSNTPTK